MHFSNQVKEDSSWNSIPAKLIENSLVVMVTWVEPGFTRYSAFSQIVPFLSISGHLEKNGCQCRAMYTTPRRPFEKVVDIVSVRNQILIFWFLKLELQILVIVGYKSVRWNHPSAHQHWSRSLSQTKSLTTINTFNFKFKSSVGRWIDTCYHYRKMSTIIKIIVRPTRRTVEGFYLMT